MKGFHKSKVSKKKKFCCKKKKMSDNGSDYGGGGGYEDDDYQAQEPVLYEEEASHPMDTTQITTNGTLSQEEKLQIVPINQQPSGGSVTSFSYS
jgi:hypothetical protein